MKRNFAAALALAAVTALLLCACSRINRPHQSQNPAELPGGKNPPTTQPVQPNQTVNGSADPALDQSSAGLEQSLNDLQNAVQLEDIPTPPAATEDPSLSSADQSLNDLQTAVNAEPTP